MRTRSCDLCSEPATHSCLLVKTDGESQHHYCYSHAVEADLLETPIDLLGPIATKSGYSINGIIFVIEALVRGKLIEDSEPSSSTATILPSLNTQKACYAVYHSAVERFGMEARTILERWNITRASDIGNILIPLVDTGILIVSENALPEGLQSYFLMGDADSLFQGDA